MLEASRALPAIADIVRAGPVAAVVAFPSDPDDIDGPCLPPAFDINVQRRRDALQWFESDQHSDLVITRSVLLLLQRLQRLQILIGSLAWEKLARRREKVALEQGSLGDAIRRTYPILEAAAGVLKEKFLAEDLAVLLESGFVVTCSGVAHHCKAGRPRPSDVEPVRRLDPQRVRLLTFAISLLFVLGG